jgi:transcriptional regulator ATRX
VIDAKQLDRHFTNDELSQLYRFEPEIDNDPLDQYDPDCVKDKILRQLMDQFSDLIVSYREHDSLLIHRDDQNLTEEEQQQAQSEGNANNDQQDDNASSFVLDEFSKRRPYGRVTPPLIVLDDD